MVAGVDLNHRILGYKPMHLLTRKDLETNLKRMESVCRIR
jgi:hypothetical protein